MATANRKKSSPTSKKAARVPVETYAGVPWCIAMGKLPNYCDKRHGSKEIPFRPLKSEARYRLAYESWMARIPSETPVAEREAAYEKADHELAEPTSYLDLPDLSLAMPEFIDLPEDLILMTREEAIVAAAESNRSIPLIEETGSARGAEWMFVVELGEELPGVLSSMRFREGISYLERNIISPIRIVEFTKAEKARFPWDH